MAVDSAGNVYVGNLVNIRKITPAGVVTTLAGSSEHGGSADGTGPQARFNSAHGLALDTAGNIYVADYYNNTIRKVTPGGVVTTLAGSPQFAPNGSSIGGSADGQGADARFNFPNDVAVDHDGNVYVADSGNHTIRKVTPEGQVSTFAGSGPGFRARRRRG